MLLGLLLTLNILICLALIAVVLLQRSEGGALGTGGSPTGLITTRGAGDLLTRTTWILFTLFLTISLALTLLGGRERSSQAILDRLKLQSINPDALTAPKPPAGAPGASIPPPVQGPSSAGASPAAAPVPRSASPPLAAPTPSVRLPPPAKRAPPIAAPAPAPISRPAPSVAITPPPAKIELSPAPLAVPTVGPAKAPDATPPAKSTPP